MIASHQVSLLVTYVLVVIFGIGSWVAINGIWVELPSLVNHAPEGWKLGAYLTVICQLANIGPITYSLVNRKVQRKKLLLHVTIYTLLVVGFLACILLSIFWRKTTYIHGERSTALLLLSFLLALVDCTSSVTFLPFMAILPEVFMSPFYVGETLSGFIPGLVVLAQGVDSPKISHNQTNSSVVHNATFSSPSSKGLKFPVEVFFVVLAFLIFLCFCSFAGLNFLKVVKRIHVHKNAKQDSANETDNDTNDSANDSLPLIQIQTPNRSPRLLLFLLICLTSLNLIQNGVISSVSSFACAPYGNMTYHLVATLGAISSGLSCFIYLWIPNKSPKIISAMSSAYFILSMYVLVIATQSPNPLWKFDDRGKVLIIIVSVVASALVSYSKLSIASIMRNEGQNYLYYAGIANQVGSFIGAFAMFPVVNYTDVFKS